MEHYVVVCDWAAVHHGCSDNGLEFSGIAHSLDEAKEIFAKAVVGEKNYAKEHNWTIYEDSEVEFDAGEEGYYSAEHVHFYIQGVM